MRNTRFRVLGGGGLHLIYLDNSAGREVASLADFPTKAR